MIQSNTNYENEFNIAIQEFIDSLPNEADKNKLNSSLNFKIQNNHISNDKSEIINEYSKYVLECFGHIEGGLCIPSSRCLLEISAFTINQRFSYLTLGKIINNKTGNDIFNVKNKDYCLNLYNNSNSIGGNIHGWITLEDGTVIDPSINHSNSQGKNNNVLIGSPCKLSESYEYIPFIIQEIFDLDNYKDKTEKDFHDIVISNI